MAFPLPDTVPYSIPRPNNMGVVRYALCFGVLLMHFSILQQLDYGPVVASLGAIGVGGFFAFSGFLSFGSFFKRQQNARRFIIDRLYRLCPAYFAVVLLAAFSLAALSSLSAAEYFTTPAFYKYISANMLFVNFMAPDLPGVFDHNVMHAVNGSLWTMKVELMLNLSVPAVWWFIKRFRCNPGAVFISIYVFSAIYGIVLNEMFASGGNQIYQILGHQVFGQLTFFYTGVFFYFYYSRLMRYKIVVLAVCATGIAAIPLIPYSYIWGRPALMATLAILISMWGRWGTWEGSRDNLSYNIYLTHFPVIQILIATGLTQIFHPALALTAVIITTVIISLLINNLVNRPFAKLHTRSHAV